MPETEQAGGGILRWLLSPTSIFLAAVIAGLVECALRAGWPRNLGALLAVGLGAVGAILYVVFFAPPGLDWSSAPVGRVLFEGLVLGLMASGTWTAYKEAVRVVQGDETLSGFPTRERRASQEGDDAERPPPA